MGSRVCAKFVIRRLFAVFRVRQLPDRGRFNAAPFSEGLGIVFFYGVSVGPLADMSLRGIMTNRNLRSARPFRPAALSVSRLGSASRLPYGNEGGPFASFVTELLS